MNDDTFKRRPASECEIAGTVLPDQLLGPEAANEFLNGNWELVGDMRPKFVKCVTNWALYPTYYLQKPDSSFFSEFEDAGIEWGRGSSEKIASQRAVIEKLHRNPEASGESLISLFAAHTKPGPLSKLPCWANVKGAKNELGQVTSIKTQQPKSADDLTQLLSCFRKVLEGNNTSVVDRAIVQWMVETEEGRQFYIDCRLDRIYNIDPDAIKDKQGFQTALTKHLRPANPNTPPDLYMFEALQKMGATGEPFHFVSVETEVNDSSVVGARQAYEEALASKSKPEAVDPEEIASRKAKLESETRVLEGAMRTIGDFYEERGVIQLPTTFRWGELAFADNPRDYVISEMQKMHPELPVEAIDYRLEKMKADVQKAFNTFQTIKGSRERFESMPLASREVNKHMTDIHQISGL